MKYIRITVRVLLGLVFIFSGFVKGIDPMGSAIKFSEYFEVFHLSWLDSISLILSIILSTAEFLIGIALLIGLRMRVTAWSAFLFMIFFTLLSLYIAIANPVSDCGCFGDAIILTNWETFYKNVIFILFAFYIFWVKDKYIPYAKPAREWSLVIAFACIMAGISIYSYKHLPLIDFLPYKVGSHIQSKMEIPANAPTPEYITTLYYSKDGVTKEFSIDNYPQDTTWHFVDSKSVLVKEGYKPPIQNFGVFTLDGTDITLQLLEDTAFSFVFISPDLTKITSSQWGKINMLYKFSVLKNFHFYFLTGSSHGLVEETMQKNSSPIPFYLTDVTTLKTIIRSNPGLLILKDGIILAKYHYNDFPELTSEKTNLMSYVLEEYSFSVETKRIYIFALILILFLTIIFYTKKEN